MKLVGRAQLNARHKVKTVRLTRAARIFGYILIAGVAALLVATPAIIYWSLF